MYTLEDIFQLSKQDIKEISNERFKNINQGRYLLAKKFYTENKLEYSDKILIYYFEIENNKDKNYFPEKLLKDPLKEISLLKEGLNKIEKICLQYISPSIGEGTSAIVFSPALGTLDYNFVSKVGFINDLTEEFKNIKILPEYINSYEIRLSKVPEVYKEQILSIIKSPFSDRLKKIKNFEKNEYYEEYKKYLNIIFGNFTDEELKDINDEEFVASLDTNLYQLKINYISGITVHNFILNNQHKEEFPDVICLDRDKVYKIQKISSKKLFPLIKALCNLFLLVKKMNKELIFHNDLHPNNLMYDGNEIILIDFERLTTGRKKLYPGNKNDQDSLIILMKILLLCGGMGNKFENFLKDNKIIKEYRINKNIFLFDGKELIEKLLECLD
uniref:Aminoglycoside phosphotransferase domain-containing protein n=1 Tax=viral metagenome TaxID=1070528 RepID=A0A6C0AER4_9ZZZZ